jgi:hypothetical protein
MCPYGTYQRATSGNPLRSLSPLKVCRLLRRKLKKSHRNGGSATLRRERKAFYKAGIEHWRNDMDTLTHFRM